ncbi:MAG: FMN-binding protein [Treponema sp.]|nr:FMN-binding protein [Treponema sp.]
MKKKLSPLAFVVLGLGLLFAGCPFGPIENPAIYIPPPPPGAEQRTGTAFGQHDWVTVTIYWYGGVVVSTSEVEHGEPMEWVEGRFEAWRYYVIANNRLPPIFEEDNHAGFGWTPHYVDTFGGATLSVNGLTRAGQEAFAQLGN